MPFTDNQLKGNWGEQYIASFLTAKNCFVRHVPQGHDSGIDLYCETTEKGLPFLHFWCQVKVRQAYDSVGEEPPLFTPEEDDLKYWKRQPIPVFICLVPPKMRNETKILFYIQTISEKFTFLNPENYTFLDGKKIIAIESLDDLDNFLNNELRYQTWFWEAERGKVGTLKTPTEEEYVKEIPTHVMHALEDKISPIIILTMGRLLADILFIMGDHNKILNERIMSSGKKDLILKRVEPIAEALEILVNKFNVPNFEYYYYLGAYYDLKENWAEAYRYYKISKDSVQDPRFRKDLGETKWQNLDNNLKSYIERIEPQL